MSSRLGPIALMKIKQTKPKGNKTPEMRGIGSRRVCWEWLPGQCPLSGLACRYQRDEQ
jgi:hypothetical protein